MNWLRRKRSLIRFHGDVVPFLPIIIWPLATALSWPGGRLSDGAAQDNSIDGCGNYGGVVIPTVAGIYGCWWRFSSFPSISSSRRYGSNDSTSVLTLCYPVAIVCYLPLLLEAPSAIEQTLVPVQSSGSFKME
jgi:hypothetical protein